MTQTIDQVLDPLESTDPFLQEALKSMAPLVEGTDAGRNIDHIQMYVVDYARAMWTVKDPFNPCTELERRCYTDNSAALFQERAIILNEKYLLETEAAIRSFALAGELLSTPYLRSDEDLAGLVDRIRPNPVRYVKHLRSLDRLPGPGNAEDKAVASFAMLMIFLIGHELGHLGQGHDQRAFGSFVDMDAPPETRLGNAVVKLARHAREFARLGFDLPDFAKAIDESSDVGANAKHWREALQDIEISHQRWFADEADADDYAITLVQQVLDRTAASDRALADDLLVCLVDALFAAALYQWQRDLGIFMGKVGFGSQPNARELSFTMTRSREHYIYAAELFGEVHRFTLLRAILAINALLHARGVLLKPIDKPVRRIEPAVDRPSMDKNKSNECLQREYLLRIHVDTAVKLAHHGSATGWILETDRARGTKQLFTMEFESIAKSIERLRQMMK